MSGQEYVDWVADILEESSKYDSCMSLTVSRYGTVELVLDTSRPTYSKWLKGIVGGDCGLICDMETDEIIGITLRVIDEKLCVHHDGPLRINEGFLKRLPSPRTD